MELEQAYTQMEHSIRGYGEKGELMDMENLLTQMETSLSDNGKAILCKAGASITKSGTFSFSKAWKKSDQSFLKVNSS